MYILTEGRWVMHIKKIYAHRKRLFVVLSVIAIAIVFFLGLHHITRKLVMRCRQIYFIYDEDVDNEGVFQSDKVFGGTKSRNF